MKSLVMKSIHTGLGLIGSGKQTFEELGRKVAKQANLSEKDGEKIAKQLRARSEKAVQTVHKTLESEVDKVVKAFHSAARELSGGAAKKPATKHHRRRAKTKKK